MTVLTLYRALGYVVAVALRGFPHGIVKYTMLRELPPLTSSA